MFCCCAPVARSTHSMAFMTSRSAWRVESVSRLGNRLWKLSYVLVLRPGSYPCCQRRLSSSAPIASSALAIFALMRRTKLSLARLLMQTLPLKRFLTALTTAKYSGLSGWLLSGSLNMWQPARLKCYFATCKAASIVQSFLSKPV